MQHVQNSEVSLESKRKHCMSLDWFTPLGNQEADIVLERYGSCQGISECVGLAQRADENVTLLRDHVQSGFGPPKPSTRMLDHARLLLITIRP